MTVIRAFKTQEVRDLAWACFSPPLLHLEQVTSAASSIQSCTYQLSPQRQHWLQELDHDPTALIQHLGQQNTHRLGVYFEQLWHFFLQQDPATELIAHNLPIHAEGRTLGEFDCIYYCRERQRHIHLELAVKFFLGIHPRGSGGNEGRCCDWLGPDNRDRLDLKLNHLLERQILLGNRSEAKKHLESLGINELDKEVAFKGYSFQPETGAPPPPGYNTDCVLQRWIPCSKLPARLAGRDAQAFLILPKMQWLSPARCAKPNVALGQRDLQGSVSRYFEGDRYPLLVAELDEHGVEIARFFVTPENWPDSFSENLR